MMKAATSLCTRLLVRSQMPCLNASYVVGNSLNRMSRPLRKSKIWLCHPQVNSSFQYRHFSTSKHMNNEDMDTEAALKLSLLEASLPFVKQYGWTNASLQAGATSKGYSSAISGIFPNGGRDLVEFFVIRSNEAAISALESSGREFYDMPMNNRIHYALKTRLSYIIPVIQSWPQALAILAAGDRSSHPSSIYDNPLRCAAHVSLATLNFGADAIRSLSLLSITIDNLIHACGDSSVSFDWYIKRATVANAYIATELFMLTDESLEFRDSWEFLQRRLDDNFDIARTSIEIQGSLQYLPQRIHAAFSAFLNPDYFEFKRHVEKSSYQESQNKR